MDIFNGIFHKGGGESRVTLRFFRAEYGSQQSDLSVRTATESFDILVSGLVVGSLRAPSVLKSGITNGWKLEPLKGSSYKKFSIA